MAEGLTVSELSALLDPPLTAVQVQHLIIILGLEPCGYRITGRPGRPAALYDAQLVMRAHSALARLRIPGEPGTGGSPASMLPWPEPDRTHAVTHSKAQV